MDEMQDDVQNYEYPLADPVWSWAHRNFYILMTLTLILGIIELGAVIIITCGFLKYLGWTFV